MTHDAIRAAAEAWVEAARGGTAGDEIKTKAAFDAALRLAAPVAEQAWKCEACGCRSYARIDVALDPPCIGRFGPGPYVRCVNCKREFLYPPVVADQAWIAEVRARAEKATPGPWKAGAVRHAGGYQLVVGSEQDSGFICEVQAPIVDGNFDEAARESLVAFIAHARTDIPRLLSEIDRLAHKEGGHPTRCHLCGASLDTLGCVKGANGSYGHVTTPPAAQQDVVGEVMRRLAKFCDDRSDWRLRCRDGMDSDKRAQRIGCEMAAAEARHIADHIRTYATALAPVTAAPAGEYDKEAIDRGMVALLGWMNGTKIIGDPIIGREMHLHEWEHRLRLALKTMLSAPASPVAHSQAVERVLRDGLAHARDLISEIIEEFHDYEDEPGSESQRSRLRGVEQHIEGVLIDASLESAAALHRPSR